MVPYKGNLFINELYKNAQLREVGDLYLLFKLHDIVSGINILLEEGYKFVDLAKTSKDKQDFINELVSSKGVCEVSMHKNGTVLDIHWHISYDFLPCKVDYLNFF